MSCPHSGNRALSIPPAPSSPGNQGGSPPVCSQLTRKLQILVCLQGRRRAVQLLARAWAVEPRIAVQHCSQPQQGPRLQGSEAESNRPRGSVTLSTVLPVVLRASGSWTNDGGGGPGARSGHRARTIRSPPTPARYHSWLHTSRPGCRGVEGRARQGRYPPLDRAP